MNTETHYTDTYLNFLSSATKVQLAAFNAIIANKPGANLDEVITFILTKIPE